MKRRSTWCPACAAGPLRRIAGDRVICPNLCETDGLGYQYMADLDGRPPVMAKDLDQLDLSKYFAPAYLGIIVEPGFAPLLCCVEQTAGQALEHLQVEWDLSKAEPVIIALWSCKAWEKGAA